MLLKRLEKLSVASGSDMLFSPTRPEFSQHFLNELQKRLPIFALLHF
jgi:hypothetical protein